MVYALAGVPPPTRFAFAGHLLGLHDGLTGINSRGGRPRPGPAAARHRDRALALAADAPEARATVEAVLGDYDLIAAVADGEGPVEVWRRR